MATVSFTHESAGALLHEWGNGTASLSDLHVRTYRQGHATALMKKLESYADKHKLVLILQVRRYGTPHEGMSNSELEMFYSKFGFIRQSDRKPVVMIRPSMQQGEVV